MHIIHYVEKPLMLFRYLHEDLHRTFWKGKFLILFMSILKMLKERNYVKSSTSYRILPLILKFHWLTKILGNYSKIIIMLYQYRLLTQNGPLIFYYNYKKEIVGVIQFSLLICDYASFFYFLFFCQFIL